jgi:cell division protein FtsL
MVHFSTTILVFAALITTGFAVPARRDASQVQNDISNIGQTVEKLNTIIANVLNDITLGLTGGLVS